VYLHVETICGWNNLWFIRSVMYVIIYVIMYICLYLLDKKHMFSSLCLTFKRYAHDEEEADDQEETGWKYIHGDVFRYPKSKSLFAACLGSGTQLFTL